jgi:hypothetical protein
MVKAKGKTVTGQDNALRLPLGDGFPDRCTRTPCNSLLFDQHWLYFFTAVRVTSFVNWPRPPL